MTEATSESRQWGASILKTPLFWAGLLVFGLAAFAYAPFYFPPTHQAVSAQSEEFFFEANEAAGAPVLFLAAWLFYRRSHYRDLLLGPGAPLSAVAVFATTVAFWSWGAYAQAHDLQLASSMGLVAGTVLILGGWPALRAFWLPIVFLAFALPLSPVLLGAVMFPIQLLTAEWAGFILNAIGVQSYVQGDQILRPENTFIVIETCSGVRTVITLSMLTILLIDLFERRGWHAAILILCAPLVAFVTNAFRVVSLVLNPHSSIHSIHNLQGIAMLLVGLTGMYLLDGLIARLLGSDDVAEQGEYGSIAARSTRSNRPGLALLAVALLLVSMIALDRMLPRWSYQRGVAELPDALLERVFAEEHSKKLQPDFQFRGSIRYLAHAERRVHLDGAPVDIHLGIADEQQRDFTLLSSRIGWPASGFEPISKERVELAPGGPLATRMILRRGARSVLSYSLIERDRSLLVEWFRQAFALDRSPWVRPQHMLAVRISTSLGPGGTGIDAADALLRKAWQRLAPELEGYAPTDFER